MVDARARAEGLAMRMTAHHPDRDARIYRKMPASRGTQRRCSPIIVRRQGNIMTVKRMDNVGIVVEDIDAAIGFFTEFPLELEAKFGEEPNGGVDVFYHDADVVHTLDRHDVSLASNYNWTAPPLCATGCRHLTMDACISIWMVCRHPHGETLRSGSRIHHWMPGRQRCGCSDRAPLRDRSATARSFALDPTFHQPASRDRGAPLRRRRHVI